MASEFRFLLKSVGGAAAKADIDGVRESVRELGHEYSHMSHRIHEIHHLVHAFGGLSALGFGNSLAHHRGGGGEGGGEAGKAGESHPGFIANAATQALGFAANFIPYVGPAVATGIGIYHEEIAGGIQGQMDRQKRSIDQLKSFYGLSGESYRNGFLFDSYKGVYTDKRTPRQVWQDKHPDQMFDPLDQSNIYSNRYELEQAGLAPPEVPTLGQMKLPDNKYKWGFGRMENGKFMSYGDPFDWMIHSADTIKEFGRWLTEW